MSKTTDFKRWKLIEDVAEYADVRMIFNETEGSSSQSSIDLTKHDDEVFSTRKKIKSEDEFLFE